MLDRCGSRFDTDWRCAPTNKIKVAMQASSVSSGEHMPSNIDATIRSYSKPYLSCFHEI